MTEDQLQSFFTRKGIKATISHYTVAKRNIYYASAGHDHLPALLFIHGSPGSIVKYANFFQDEQLLDKFSMYAVDRPGYGLSATGNAVTSLSKQADMLYPLAERIHRVHQPLIIVASSYGASVACRMVMDHPGLVQGMVLVSPALAPGPETIYWPYLLVKQRWIHNMLPAEYATAAMEKITHKKELKKMLPYWKKINIPVIYLQSRRDSKVNSTNAAFAKEMMKNVSLLDINLYPGRKHDITTKQHKNIIKKILEMDTWLEQQSKMKDETRAGDT